MMSQIDNGIRDLTQTGLKNLHQLYCDAKQTSAENELNIFRWNLFGFIESV